MTLPNYDYSNLEIPETRHLAADDPEVTWQDSTGR